MVKHTYKKLHRTTNRLKLIVKNDSTVCTSYMLATHHGTLNKKQLEAARRAIVRTIGKNARLSIHVKPNIPITAKSLESRMGKGVGKLKDLITVISPGDYLLSLKGVNNELAVIALNLAKKKLPIRVVIV